VITWLTSSSCADGSCVQVARDGDQVLIRDGKMGDASPVIAVPAADWPAVQELLKGFR
jgi:hypothetical protein